MMIKVKMMLTLNVDEDDYPIPADGKVSEEIESSIQEFLYDIDGVKIQNIRTVQENKND